MKKLAVILAVFAFLAPALSGCMDLNGLIGAGGEKSLESPNGRISVQVSLLDSPQPGTLAYEISFDGKQIICPSPLGIEIDGKPLDANFKIVGSKYDSKDETYELPVGKSEFARDHYNEMTVSVECGAIDMNVIFRAYDDAVAFRYHFPQQKGSSEFTITNESTSFCIPEDYTSYAVNLGSFMNNYEGFYNPTKISEIKKGDIIGVPLLVDAGSAWFAIAEANLRNYGGMYVTGTDSALSLKNIVTPSMNNPATITNASAPFSTPWRLVMIAESPGRFVESNIMMNLNEPCALDDTSWIKPGKVAWPWWKFMMAATTDIHKYYIDFAASHGIEYVIVDAGWYCTETDAWASPEQQDATDNKIPWMNVTEIIKYGKEKGVGVMLWVHEDTLKLKLDEALAAYASWGAKGVKVDGDGGNHVERVNLYWEIVEAAAKYNLAVDFHGAYTPTGMGRTYPNLLTQEGIRGEEYRGPRDKPPFSDLGTSDTPQHYTTIPFTRMLMGPMDFTPGAFGIENFNQGYPNIQGTRCGQMAMFVVYESELQMLIDAPFDYEGAAGFEFIEKVPTTWDETVAVNDNVADYVTIARRSGSTWYVGSICGETAREIAIPLQFLGPGKYEATIWEEGSNIQYDPTDIVSSTQAVDSSAVIKATMMPGGGQCIIIQPKS
ncbi:MAG: glycoside hydrolase family 97 protein [Candidatus Thermoplasmatota archaeon]|nr:glycoside hydrolase family 97 protein [Candidatus Thermoplasmatota archaeon]